MSQQKKKPGPKPGVKPRRVKQSVSMEPKLLRDLNDMAKIEEMSLSELIDRVLRYGVLEYINRQGLKKST
jgi:metal-responsive CopG/Arc/MetJ family transcriptional regulator